MNESRLMKLLVCFTSAIFQNSPWTVCLSIIVLDVDIRCSHLLSIINNLSLIILLEPSKILFQNYRHHPVLKFSACSRSSSQQTFGISSKVVECICRIKKDGDKFIKTEYELATYFLVIKHKIDMSSPINYPRHL